MTSYTSNHQSLSAIKQANDTAYRIPFLPVSEQIHRQALSHPDKTAIICSGKKLTFQQLDNLSTIVANYLIKKITKPNSLIGVLLERSELVYIAEQAILKAHAAFLPFTTSYPDERIIFSLQDASSEILLTSRNIIDHRPAISAHEYEVFAIEDILQAKTDDRYPSPEGITKNDLAYCIYTSGSTGRPKGVMITQGNLVNYVSRNEKSIEIMHYAKPGRISLAMASFSFDVSVVEQFVPLCNGNTVCITTEKEIHDPFLLAEMITKNQINAITCTPTFLSNIINIPICTKALKQIDFFDIGSEAFSKHLYSKLRSLRKDSIIMNVYGPTECTMGCSAAVISSDETITIGRPMANTKFYVIDSDGKELSAGQKGELIICGNGVGKGYINLPEKTAENFFVYKGMPAYHSGDLVSWTDDGQIRIWGRIDNQIKLRGFRIELDEIERVINTYPDVKRSAVKLCHSGTDFLAAYITADKPINTDHLRTFINKQLPNYMIPSVFMQLEVFPETVNGKIDKYALPEAKPQKERQVIRPRNKLETSLRSIFAEVLNIDEHQISMNDDFFDLGGDSLKSMVLISHLRAKGITSADIYACRSIERISDFLSKNTKNESLEQIEECERKKPHFLSTMQTKMIDYQFAMTNSTMWNNMYYLFRFNKKTDPERLRKAVNQTIHHYPAFSMNIGFNENGQMVQTYVPDSIPEIRYEKISDMELILHKDELVKPFRMFNTPLVRVRMFLSDRYSYLFFDVHHLAMDGACISILMTSLAKAYQGEELPPDYYCSYLASEDAIRKSPKYEEDKAYFEEKYGGYDWCFILQPDKKEITPLAAGRVVRFPFDKEDMQAAEKRLNTTRSVISIAAAIQTLHEVSGKNDIMTNWIFNNRLGSFASDSIGMMIKNLPVGIHMDQIHNLSELIAEIKKQVADGISHCSYDYFSATDSAFTNDPMEVNYQQNMNANEIEILHPFRIDLDNNYHAPGARLELEFLENDDNRGFFDSEIEWAANCFSEDRILEFHNRYIENIERIVLE